MDMFTFNDNWVLPKVHYCLVGASIFFLAISLPCFVFCIALEPGYLEKKYDFKLLVQQFLEEDRDLGLLCTYCQVVKSPTSFHCQLCNKCVELFDHHCPFINNCLGMRNYKYFLTFILSYFLFLLSLALECIRNYYDQRVDRQHYVEWIDYAVFIMIGLSLPVVSFQLASQVKQLCTSRHRLIEIQSDQGSQDTEAPLIMNTTINSS